MDATTHKHLDEYISKLQKFSRQIAGSRKNAFFKGKRDERGIALKSASVFLSCCALVGLLRKNLSAVCDPGCVGLITIPAQWQLSDVVKAANLIIDDDCKIKVCTHPLVKHHKRGWEIEPDELLAAGRLLVFVSESSEVHPDFELATTFRARLDVCTPRHLKAVAALRRCGAILPGSLDLITKQPSERMEAIFRSDQPAQRAADRLSVELRRQLQEPVKQLNISKGFGAVGEWAQEFQRDLQAWRVGQIPWSEIDKGALFWGPPGTGKTRFAVALAASSGLHLEATSISQWQSSGDGHLGDMLKAMFRSFAAAKENSPSILFIDEIDGIGDRRKFPARHSDYSTQVVNALLEALDGVEQREGVIVLAACNHPEKIDQAVVRGGRLEKHIHFALPDAVSRAEILEFHLPALADHPKLKEIAARLPGKSGADLEMLARHARRRARQENRSVKVDDLQASIEPLPALDSDYQFQVAAHEAGHALVAHAFRVGEIVSVEIFDNQNRFATELDAHGLTKINFHTPPFRTRWQLTKLITMHLAGAAAEEVCFKDRSTMAVGSDNSDFAQATSLAIEMVTSLGFGEYPYYLPGSVDLKNPIDLWSDQRLATEVKEILRVQYNRARDMLSGLLANLMMLATELAKHKKLEADQLEPFWPGNSLDPDNGVAKPEQDSPQSQPH
ncbi:AAA family ATPase [Rhizobium ruizarguesonis]